MTRKIKEKYLQLNNKLDFVVHMSELDEIPVKASSIKNNHLGGTFDIPEKYWETYITELDKWLEKEKVKP